MAQAIVHAGNRQETVTFIDRDATQLTKEEAQQIIRLANQKGIREGQITRVQIGSDNFSSADFLAKARETATPSTPPVAGNPAVRLHARVRIRKPDNSERIAEVDYNYNGTPGLQPGEVTEIRGAAHLARGETVIRVSFGEPGTGTTINWPTIEGAVFNRLVPPAPAGSRTPSSGAPAAAAATATPASPSSEPVQGILDARVTGGGRTAPLTVYYNSDAPETRGEISPGEADKIVKAVKEAIGTGTLGDDATVEAEGRSIPYGRLKAIAERAEAAEGTGILPRPTVTLEERRDNFKRKKGSLKELLEQLAFLIFALGDWTSIKKWLNIHTLEAGYDEAEVATVMIHAMEQLDIGDAQTRQALADLFKGGKNDAATHAKLQEFQTELRQNEGLRQALVNGLRDAAERYDQQATLTKSLYDAESNNERLYAFN